MRKILTVLFLLGSVVTLSGCDLFDTGINNVWYDEMSGTINISYRVTRPSEDEETGEVPIEHLYLLGKTEDLDWFEIQELDQYTDENLQIEFRDYYGDVELKIVKQDEEGNVLFSTESYHIWIQEPQYIFHFDTNFDSWNGSVYFNFGVNEQVAKNFIIEKSNDGGLSWEEVMADEITYSEDHGFKTQFTYYEYSEGNYVYRLTVLDENETFLAEMTSYNEVSVYFQDHNFDGTPEIQYVGSNLDVYSRNVNIWWNAQGDFENVLIEKSSDLETFEEIGTVPRFVQSFDYTEETDGEYYYRVSAIKEENVVSSKTTEDELRVRDGVLIGYLDTWFNWDTQSINISWDFQSEDVVEVEIERKHNDNDYESLGVFGKLKKMHTDENLAPGVYIYQISLLDVEGNVLDSQETSKIEIEQPKHVYHLDAWFNQSTGEVQFSFGFNQNFVTYYTIEKSNDGGLTWTELLSNQTEITDEHWYKDHILVYELEEGTYAYRLTGYYELDQVMGEALTHYEVVVDYSSLNYEEPTEVHYLEGNFNIYDSKVNLWWNTQGNYETHLIEVSQDGETWEEVTTLPRVATFYAIDDMATGQYFFRVSAVDESGVVLDSYTSENKISVRENALIGSINGWYDHDQNKFHLNWDIIKDNVSLIKIERTNTESEETILLGEFGSLKTTLMDENLLDGVYVYTITLLDSEGTVLDQLDSKVIEILNN